jgi:hypothetical protein
MLNHRNQQFAFLNVIVPLRPNQKFHKALRSARKRPELRPRPFHPYPFLAAVPEILQYLSRITFESRGPSPRDL